MNRRTFLIGAGAALITVSGCSEENPASEPTGSTTTKGGDSGTPAAEDAISINEDAYQEAPDPGVTGKLENTGEESVGVVTISAKFYDPDEVRLEDWTVTLKDISPGVVVEFEIPYPDTDSAHRVDSYELTIKPEPTRYSIS